MAPGGKKITILAGLAMLIILAVTAWLYRAHIRFWWLFEAMGRNEFGLREYRHRQTGIVMVRVPGGRFWMGAQRDDPTGYNHDPNAEMDEGPVHKVELSSFLMAKYEVSQAQWERTMSSNPSKHQGDELPVEKVSWDNCQKYCRATGLKLPTEAQWEYACRAGTTTPFHLGLTISSEQVTYFGEFPPRVRPQYPSKTAPVTSLKPNGFGLHHMHGNVQEWCQDLYDARFYASPLARQADPVCTKGSSPERQVVRGGNFDFRDVDCRTANRQEWFSGYDSAVQGLRLAFYPIP